MSKVQNRIGYQHYRTTCTPAGKYSVRNSHPNAETRQKMQVPSCTAYCSHFQLCKFLNLKVKKRKEKKKRVDRGKTWRQFLVLILSNLCCDSEKVEIENTPFTLMFLQK